MLRLITIFVFFCAWFVTVGQKAVSNDIARAKAHGQVFQPAPILQFGSADIHARNLGLEGLKKGTLMQLDQEAIALMIHNKPEFIVLPVPVSDRKEIILTLKRHEIFAPGFKLVSSEDPDGSIDYTPGLHYRGIIEGDSRSLVAVSVFQDQVIAMIANDDGNHVIGPLKDDRAGRHVYYNDRDLMVDIGIKCGTPDETTIYTDLELQPQQQGRDLNDCVRIYIEINDDIVTAKGGAVQAADYITAIMNQSFVLYANEDLSLVISEMLAWTTPSPYTGEDSQANLTLYKQYTQWFNGDLSHLITFDSLYGVAQGLAGVCNPNPDLSKCVSGITNHYESVPIFSWPVELVTHEMGHLLGSSHTHACVWNGNGTSIDACGYWDNGDGESPCPGPDPQIPVNGGTIMSYCTPGRGYFKNFNEGFGPQPGDVIRNKVNAAGNCLTPCGQPTSYCISESTNSSTEYIDKVILNTINNPSGNNGGYEDFTALSTSLTAGNTYTITLTPKFTGGNKVKSWKVWIDYNGDFDWYDHGEVVAEGTGNNTINLNFTVPSNASNITTRMRVSMKYPGAPTFCGTFSGGEVEDYTIVVMPAAPSCTDGIQNQGEAGVDCGGPCIACPTCMDGIQNQGEMAIDCGGPCEACPVSDSTVVLATYFETGMDGWIDGGPDVTRVQSANSWEGQYSIELADNSGAQSAMTSPTLNLSSAVGVFVAFHFYPVSMEAGEDFWVQYRNGSGNWTTIATFTAGSDFTNGNYYLATLTVPNFVPTASGSFRIQCDASDNNDQVFIDAVIITQLNGNELIEVGVTVTQVDKPEILTAAPDETIVLYPNPAKDILHISCAGDIQSIRMMTIDGMAIKVEQSSIVNKEIDIQDLPAGLYFLWIQASGEWHQVKFCKM